MFKKLEISGPCLFSLFSGSYGCNIAYPNYPRNWFITQGKFCLSWVLTSVRVAFVLIFAVVQLCTAEYVIYGRKMTFDNNLSLNPNRCHHPLITQLSMKHCTHLEGGCQKESKLATSFMDGSETLKDLTPII